MPSERRKAFEAMMDSNSVCMLRSGKRLLRSARETSNGENGGATMMVNSDDENNRIIDVNWKRRKVRSIRKRDRCDRFYANGRKTKRVASKEEDDKNNKNLWGFWVVMKPSCGRNAEICSQFLFRALFYIMRLLFSLKELLEFLLMEPFPEIYASQGICLPQGPPVSHRVGVCQFFGITQFMPMFCVDFSAIPFCFLHMHSAMYLKSTFRSHFLVYSLANATEANEVDEGSSLDASVKSFSLPGQKGQGRNKSKNYKGIQGVTTTREDPNPNPAMADTRNGALHTQLSDQQEEVIIAAASNEKIGCLANSTRPSKANSAAVDSTEGLNLSHCSANILIPQSDNSDNSYYRVGGAVITFEQIPSSRNWLLAIKKDGMTWYTFKAEKFIMSSTSKKFSQWRMFFLDNGWKLEFADDKDWRIFKTLYKDCFGRNLPGQAAKTIPVPRVRDVSDCADTCNSVIPFVRSHTYISNGDDEFNRAMKRNKPNYDMDSEDETWLRKFNNESRYVSEENFELIVDALEKAFYFYPDVCSDAKSAANRCPQDLGSKEVVIAVSQYWTRKRKQKSRPLLRIFQNYPAKALVTPRRMSQKRSLRRPSRYGGGKYDRLWQVTELAAELKESKKMKAAKASADALRGIAIQKRKRAQNLVRKADLAVFRAMLLFRMAEVGESAHTPLFV